jgi:hypothetical protein
MMIVLTIDQRSSRASADLVPPLLVALNKRTRADGLVRRFERTAGDEVQGVLDNPVTVVGIVAELIRTDTWSIGIGVGEVAEPLPRMTRAGRGEAFLNAREAVTLAKNNPHRLSVVGADPYAAERTETVLWLLALVLRRRSIRGWEVADLLSGGLTRREVSQRLGISQSAVSQRAQAAGVVEEQRARRLAAELLFPAPIGEPA